MLLFDAVSPAPRCLRMFILEKELTICAKTIDVFAGVNREEDYLDINPAGQTPAMQLQNGDVIAEAVAIAEYLEEQNPYPSLIGKNENERAETRMWWRRVELNITEFIHNAYHYSEGLERFKDRIPAVPEAAEGLKMVAQDRLAWLDKMMWKGPYLCGTRFTTADIWLYVWLDFAQENGQPFDKSLPHIGPWFEKVAARPSAELSRKTFNDSKCFNAGHGGY